MEREKDAHYILSVIDTEYKVYNKTKLMVYILIKI